MVSGKYSALASAVSKEQAFATITNNLANISTAGYKKTATGFESILKGEQQIGDARGINYSRVSQSTTDFSQGPLKETGNIFDLAIHGAGFFKIQGPDGPLYTRSGSFTLDNNGNLITHNGYPVLDSGDTPITVGNNEGKRISINALGTISALDAIGNREEIGRIAIVDIDDRSRLKRTANTMFQLDEEGQERPVQEPQIISGSLELANVNMVEEMARMINNNKLYQIYHKVIKGYATISEKQDELGTVS